MANTAITGSDLTNIRAGDQVISDALLCLVKPDVIATATVSAVSALVPTIQVTVSGTSGWSDVAVGQLVRFKRSGSIIAYAVVRKAPTSSILYISETNLGAPGYPLRIESALAAGDTLEVLSHRPLWPMYSTIQGRQFYKLWDVGYSGQNANPAPVANAGTWQAGRLGAGDTEYRFRLPRAGSNTSHAMSGALSSYSWTLPSGVALVGGYNLTDSVIEVDADPGQHLIKLTVTDSGARTGDAYVWLFVSDAGTSYATAGEEYAWAIVRDEQDARGREMEFELYGEDLNDLLFPGQAALFREFATHNGAVLSTGTLLDTFVGYISALSVEHDGNIGRASITVVSPLIYAQSLVIAPQQLEEKASPATWAEMGTALSHPRGALYYALKWHCPNLLEMHDFDAPYITPRSKFWTYDVSSIYDACNVAAQAITGSVGSTSDGKTTLRRDARMEDNDFRNALASVLTLSEADIRAPLRLEERMQSEYRETRTGAFAYDGTLKAWYAIKRWYPGTGSDVLPNFVVPVSGGRDEVLAKVGHHMARLNAPIPEIALELTRNMDVFEPAEWCFVTLNIGATYDPRGEGVSLRALPLRVSRTWENDAFGLRKSLLLTVAPETFGQPGEEWVIGSANLYWRQGQPTPFAPLAAENEAFPMGLAAAVNSLGQAGMTFTLPAGNPNYFGIDADGENIHDIDFDYNSGYFASGYVTTEPIGLYVLSSDGTTLNIRRIDDIRLTNVASVLHTITMGDGTQRYNARIKCSKDSPDNVAVAWKDRTGVQVVRTTDGGANWSSAIRVGSSITDSSDNDDAVIGLDMKGSQIYVTGPNASSQYGVYQGTGSFNLITGLSTVTTPIPMILHNQKTGGDVRLYVTQLPAGVRTEDLKQNFDDASTITYTNGTDLIPAQYEWGVDAVGNPGNAMYKEHIGDSGGTSRFHNPLFILPSSQYVFRVSVDVWVNANFTVPIGTRTFLQRLIVMTITSSGVTTASGTATIATHAITGSAQAWPGNSSWQTITFTFPGWTSIAKDIRVYHHFTDQATAMEASAFIDDGFEYRLDNFKVWTAPVSSGTARLYRVNDLSGTPGWTDISPASSRVPRGSYALNINPVDGALHAAATVSDTNWYTSTNEGTAWTLVEADADTRVILSSGAAILTAGNDEMRLSVDGGAAFEDKRGNLSALWESIGTIKRIIAL